MTNKTMIMLSKNVKYALETRQNMPCGLCAKKSKYAFKNGIFCSAPE